MDEIARRYRHLSASLAGKRDTSERLLLIDRVRDALDRHVEALTPSDATIIANSFTTEEVVYLGMTQVVRLRHRDLGTMHAMKTLAPQNADDPVLRDMLLREARMLLAIDHPNVVRGQILLRLPDGRPALVMEWLGETLAQALETRPFTSTEIAAMTAALLECIEAVADAGLVHGDIAPSNIFVTGQTKSPIKIADFSASVTIESAHPTHDLKLAARPLYAAPEQLAGKPLDAACDVHACGVLLSRMCEAGDPHDRLRNALAAFALEMRVQEPSHRPSAMEARKCIQAMSVG